jgi:hypothetical protein
VDARNFVKKEKKGFFLNLIDQLLAMRVLKIKIAFS